MNFKTAFIIVLVLLLSGCIPKTHKLSLYDLKVTSTQKAVSRKNITLKVNYPTALNALGGSRIYYNDNSRVGYYLYSRWSSSLNRIIYSDLIIDLLQSQKYRSVVGYSSSAHTDRELELSIVTFNHIIKNQESYTDISFNVKIIDNKSGKILKTKLFKYKSVVNEKNAQSFVKAAREDLKEFFNDLNTF